MAHLDGRLAQRIVPLVRDFPGSSAVYVRDLTTGAGAAWNARARFPAGSTLKLAIAVEALRTLGGKPAPGSYADGLLRRAIIYSDNVAANQLEVLFGGSTSGGSQRVNSLMRALGLVDSEMYGGYIPGTLARRRPIPRRVDERPYYGVGKSTSAYDLAQLFAYVHLAAEGKGRLARRHSGFTATDARYLLYLLAHVADRGKLDRLLAGKSVLAAQGGLDHRRPPRRRHRLLAGRRLRRGGDDARQRRWNRLRRARRPCRPARAPAVDSLPSDADAWTVLPETKYAKKGDVHIAYQVVGDGPLDLVLCSLWFSHLEARWDIPGFAHYLRRLAAFTRLISFDKQGIGLSDPVPLDQMPPIEEWMDDVRVVMDETGSERAALMGANEGAMMAAVFAATYPERVSALVLVNATGCPTTGPDNEFGLPPDVTEGVVSLIGTTWGTTEAMATLNPSVAGDEAALAAWSRFLRLAASPAVAAAVTRMIFELDVREVLPMIRVPTLVINRRGNPLIPVEAGREVARRIPGAKWVELPGDDYGVAVGDTDTLIDHVEEFLTGARAVHDGDRVLSTVLFADIVSSTERAVELGDAKWRELLEAFEHTGRQEVQRFGGVVADFAGDGLLASFDGPARRGAVRFQGA